MLFSPSPADHRRAADELHEANLGLRAKRPEILLLERLDEHRRVAPVPAVFAERGEQRLLQRQLDVAEIGRMLGLGIDTDVTSARRAELLRERDDLVERRNLKLAVVRVRPRRRSRSRARSVLISASVKSSAEPAGQRLAIDRLRPLAIGKAIGDVGRAADLVLVPRDEDAVFGRDEIRLDEVGAHLDRQPVGLQRVLGPMAAGAAVRDDERPRRHGRRHGRRRGSHHQTRAPTRATTAA